MPDNVLQLIAGTAFRATARTLEAIFTPPKDLGTPLKKKPVGADPVVIVHGVTDSARGSVDFARSLRRDGFTVYTPTLPFSGLDGVDRNVEFLNKYVADVMRETGAKKVDMIGHSQGGLSILGYIKFGKGKDTVDSAISIAAPHHGVGAPWVGVLDVVRAIPITRWGTPKGLDELDDRSDLIKRLTKGDETPGNIRYTSIYSKDFDGIVGPGSSPRLRGAKNIALEKPRWGLGMFRGPHHLFINHQNEAYMAARKALLSTAKPLADAATGAALTRQPGPTKFVATPAAPAVKQLPAKTR